LSYCGWELGTTLTGGVGIGIALEWDSDKTQVPVLWTGLGLVKWGLD
jgi:hypothetical protein